MDTNLIQQFQFLVQDNSGVKLEKVIEQILESNLYHTGGILNSNNVQKLDEPKGANKHFNTLELFTKENYSQYKGNKGKFIELTGPMLEKLKITSILEFAKDNKNLTFTKLYKDLDIVEPFEIDSLLFQAIKLGLISGKVDHRNKIFRVISVKGRDYLKDINKVEAKIGRWIDNLERTEQYIEKQIESLRNDTKQFNIHIDEKVAKVTAVQQDFN